MSHSVHKSSDKRPRNCPRTALPHWLQRAHQHTVYSTRPHTHSGTATGYPLPPTHRIHTHPPKNCKQGLVHSHTHPPKPSLPSRTRAARVRLRPSASYLASTRLVLLLPLRLLPFQQNKLRPQVTRFRSSAPFPSSLPHPHGPSTHSPSFISTFISHSLFLVLFQQRQPATPFAYPLDAASTLDSSSPPGLSTKHPDPRALFDCTA